MGLFEEIASVVVEGDKDGVVAAVKKALAEKADPMDIIQKGLTPGITIVGDKFEKMEMYLPEMLLAADAMKAGVELVTPVIKVGTMKKEGVVVIGTITGDVHDIGKNIVAIYLEALGFTVHDLGKDIPITTFVDQAEEKKADIIGISALLSSTMAYMPDIVEELKRRKIRDKYIVLLGGGAVTPEWAAKIGADGCGTDFAEAAKLAKKLIQAKKLIKVKS
jgi:corrinoid protein of di/trimethylamine methyltransferase